MEKNWFALRVKARHERVVVDFAATTGLEALSPVSRNRHRWTQRWKDVETPLFPGYVFCRFDRAAYSRLMNLPGVVDVVRFGKTLAVIDELEIAALRRVQAEGCQIEPCVYLPAGQQIAIISGPLQGLVGNVLMDNGAVDLVLSVTMLQRSVRVKLDRNSITSIDTAIVAMSSQRSELRGSVPDR